MRLIILFSLAILILSSNVALAGAQKNDLEFYETQKKSVEKPRKASKPLKNKKGEMSKEQEENILINLSPEAKSKMEEIKKLDEIKYYQLLDSFNSRDFPNSTENPSSTSKIEIKKEKLLEIDVQLLTLKYKNADAASKSKIKKDLTAKLSDLFDIREAKKQKQVKRLESRLQELNESLEARKKNKDVIIERRIEELLGNSKYLEW